jgi:NADH-quinone oxidoreductase subunit L
MSLTDFANPSGLLVVFADESSGSIFHKMELGIHPGLFFVGATLLPLASFVLLLIASGVRAFLRPLIEQRTGERVTPPRWPAYVATGAIAGAFVFCLVAAFVFFADHNKLQDAEQAARSAPAAEQEEKEYEVEKLAHQTEERWNGHWPWLSLSIGGRVLQLGYHIDHLSVVMFLMVTFIATLIHVYSIGYMGDELKPMVEDHQVHTAAGHLTRRGRFGRFFLFLSLFCFSMLNLVLADNFFQVFISWELVGICSYLLIGFYYERRSASTAANKAFITNRVGDAGFIVGLLILFAYFGTFNFEEVFAQVRSPFRDAHSTQLERGGEIVRADLDHSGTGAPVLRVSERGSGSQVVLFPAKPDLDPTKFGHAHTVKKPGDRVELPVSERNPEHDYGTIPYWMLVVAGLGIFLGCVGKSAQFPLHVWLPDAMEGPTPVSALIHAATMVAAGVYFVGRVFPLFTPEARLTIAYTGGITLFVAATIAIVMTDIKKVLAYSTVSQLGYMMLALGVGGWVAGEFHLLTHAFFKALLFLGSGSVIYGCHHEQEMTKMGGLYPKMKITAVTMFVGVLAIAGIPLFSGWYSKDAILAQALGFVIVHPQHGLLFLLPLATAGITTFYMFRMWFMTFTGDPRDHHVYEHAHESPWLMTMPLIVLALFSIVVAWGWPVWDAEASTLEHHIHHAQPLSIQADYATLSKQGETWPGAPQRIDPATSVRQLAADYHALTGAVATGIVLLSIIFAALVYWKPYQKLDPAETKEQFPRLHAFLLNKWYFDELYSAILVRPALVVSQAARWFDTRVIDGLVNNLARVGVLTSRLNGIIDACIVDGLVNVIARACWGVGSRLRAVQTGSLRNYVLFLALAAVAIFVVLTYFVTRALAG